MKKNSGSEGMELRSGKKTTPPKPGFKYPMLDPDFDADESQDGFGDEAAGDLLEAESGVEDIEGPSSATGATDYGQLNKELNKLRETTAPRIQKHERNPSFSRPISSPTAEEKDGSGSSSSSSSLYFLLTLLIGIIVALIGVFLPNTPLMVPTPAATPRESFSLELEKMKSKYDEIVHELSWQAIKVGVDDVLSRNETTLGEFRVPTVILMVESKKMHSNVVRCLGVDLLRIISRAHGETPPEVIEAKDLNSTLLKERLHYNFGKNQKHGVFVDGIELLKGSDALALHPFTNHDSATYTDVIIILSAYAEGDVFIDGKEKGAILKSMDQVAMSVLEKAWITSIDEDQISALLSRLVSRVVAVPSSRKNAKISC